MAEKKEKLFDQFPEVSTQEWRAKVDADLKGAPFEKKLVWRTNEGFNVQPMYRAEDIADLKTTESLPGEYPYLRGIKDNNDWLTRQDIIADTPADANAIALDILTKGVTSLGFKVADPSVETISTLLNGIDISKVEINFDCCQGKVIALTEALVEYLINNELTQAFKGSINFNPIKRSFKHGTPVPADIVEKAKHLIEVVTPVPQLRILAINSEEFNAAGSYIFQELGYALAWGAQWLTSLTDAGLSVDQVAKRIKFNMGISSNYFMELAKFRAGRMLWAQIVKQYQPDCDCACKMHVHASTSRFNQTIYDAHVNLLRSQTESMSAALAGVDSITTLPFDLPYKTPDTFSERIARNQQFLLKEESHLDKVVDPAGGSYYIETLTVSIANEAWKLFLDVEENGGFFKAVDNGAVQKAVNESGIKRHADMARRKEILLGTNQYPNFNEKALDKIEKWDGACGCGCANSAEANPEHVLSTKRQASDFEELRLTTEKSANRPKVFMLTIGNLAMRLARAQFSANFFGCAGYEIIDNIGFETVEDGVKAAKEANADVIVLCSSDEEYAELAPEAFKLIDGKAEFVVAGAPACSDDLKAIGINNFINVRSNVLETLQAFNAKLLK